jgi:flagellar basal-body rod protein FlgF
MENIGYVGLSQQMAIQQQMNITANNIANMNTPGFKAMSALFIDFVNKPRGATGAGLNQVMNQSSYRNLAAGSMQRTGNSLDVAIQGDGYFSVQTAAGDTAYTRDGSFTLNVSGEIIDRAGNKVLSDGGSPLVVPPEATDIQITPEGLITSRQGEIGRLKVVDVDKPQRMQRLGDNLLKLNGAAEVPATNARVLQGSVEGSNVNPVTEMNKMIELLRLYQSTQRMMQNDHERIRTAIQKLSNV